jgi:hypothetical protein
MAHERVPVVERNINDSETLDVTAIPAFVPHYMQGFLYKSLFRSINLEKYCHKNISFCFVTSGLIVIC